MILNNIENARGLTGSEKHELRALLDVWSNVKSRNERLKLYYESDVVAESIGIDTIPPSVNIKESCSWPKKAVTSVSERSRFDGFVFESGEVDPMLAAVVRDNGLIGSYNRHVPSELLHGCMAATVGRVGNSAIVRFHTAETCAMTWDSGAGRIGSGFVIADMKLTQWSPTRPVPVQVNLHLPRRVVVITRTGAATWNANGSDIPIDRPMMEPFAFRATGVKPFGESRISKTVMTLTDDVLRTLVNMTVSGAFYANPMKYLLGLTNEQFDEISKDKWSSAIGAMMIATRDDSDNIPTFGQLQATSPQPYIDMLRTYATLFSGSTGVPLNSLGIVQDNPSSAEAIAAAREDICIAAEDLNESSRESLRNVALMAMAVSNNTSIDGLTDDQKSVMAHFRDPAMPSIVSQADAAVKVASADSGFAGTDVFYEMLGFDSATIARIKSDKKKSLASMSIASALSAATTDDAEPIVKDAGGETKAEVSGKGLNGAQAQSLIAIMSQFTGGQITEGQAVNLIASAIGVEKQDARDILNGKM